MPDRNPSPPPHSPTAHSPTHHSPLHSLSFDIEDWFHIVEVKAVEDPSLWPGLSARSSLVERYTDLILRICDDARVRATFFMLGWIAEKHPALVQRIAAAGHELATHSFWHRKVYELTPDVFARDIADSIAAIRAAVPAADVRGFRAPSFSITRGSEWAFDVLLDAGLTYDASLFPAARGHGGYACTAGPHIVTAPSGRPIPELPMSIARFGPKKLCYSGGGYMRLLPSALISYGLKQEAAQGRGTVVYLHPRDFATDCPRVPMPPHRAFKCYIGMKHTEAKLRRLLDSAPFTTCRHALQHARLLPPDSQTAHAAHHPASPANGSNPRPV
ncbi:MAG: polysaccharide deacetylase family protein [Planctomycetota bacterium]|nr:polysaccharide deacetylase family protein [Planctomycetota bacterium]